MYVSCAWQPNTHATICDLPQELLLLILSHVQDWKYWLKHHCSCVCRCLRAACLELIDFRAVNACGPDSPKHFTAFISDYPRVARSIVKLRIRGSYGLPRPVMNATLVAYIIGQLPSLQNLTLNIMRFDSTDATDDVDASVLAPIDIVGGRPRSLKRLELHYDIDEQSLLPEVFRIASLFQVEELYLNFSDCFDLTSASVPFSLPRPLHASSLSVNHTLKSQKHAAVMFDALSVHLSPGVLQRLEVSVDSAECIHSLGRLLSGPACSALTYLDLNSPPPVKLVGFRLGWLGHKDPLQCTSVGTFPSFSPLIPTCRTDEWSALNVGLCPRLESIVLHVYAADMPCDMPLCSAATGIVSQAPPALRYLTLKIWYFSCASLIDSDWLNLGDLDTALSRSPGFSKLEKLTVELYRDYHEINFPEYYKALCQRTLSAVHSARKLHVVQR